VKILLTGAAGQLGQELLPRLADLGEVVAVDLSAPGDGDVHIQFDLANEGQTEVLLNRHAPDLVVNAAAYTAVDQAEREPEMAFTVNASIPGRMARWAERSGSAMLHYSTDYVFDGELGRAYRETDTPAPLNAYGESKYAGELAIQASGCRHLILRSSWIYSAHGNNFVLKMLQLAQQQPNLSVVGDQTGCPTWARNLAATSILAIRKGLVGRKRLPVSLLHSADRDQTSWFEFASRVFDTAESLGILRDKPAMREVNSDEFPQIATRPRCSALDSSAMSEVLGIAPAGLDESLRECLQEMRAT
jgi:dTDP-4-dehydrorhamnose reductase